MDPRILRYYNRELQHLREMGGEFAKEFPKIAGRLGLEKFECADPYVERLLEGFAFLAARVQLKLDAEFPRFTQHLLEKVYPHYLAPTPSMAVVQFQPDLNEATLADGFTIPRHSAIRSLLGKGEQTPCEYRTSHPVTLWPLEITDAKYYTYYRREAGALDVPDIDGVKAAIRLRLKTTAGLKFSDLSLDRLQLFLRGSDAVPKYLYEQLVGNTVAVVARSTKRPAPWHHVVESAQLRQVGFEDEEALLTYGLHSFQGYRLLREYFAFPDRFLFVEVGNLAPGLRRLDASEMDIVFLLDRVHPELENSVDSAQFGLFCAPAVNLFSKRADRIHLSDQFHEYHVIPDRTRPIDFEVYEVKSVVGFGTSPDSEQEFLPLYASSDLARHSTDMAFFAVHRVPRALSAKQRRRGPRSSYVGSEVFVSLVDSREAPYRSDLRQLAIETLCTNRDLPLAMAVGGGRTDFTMELGAPVESVRCVAGPTRPKTPHPEGEAAWRLISHLALNYLTLIDTDEQEGSVALRDLLTLYSGEADPSIHKQIEGVRSVTSQPIARPIPVPGLLTFGRGLELSLLLEEAAFEGTGVFLLTAVLERFFARYVSLNSFTETVVRTVERGEVYRWPTRAGLRQII